MGNIWNDENSGFLQFLDECTSTYPSRLFNVIPESDSTSVRQVAFALEIVIDQLRKLLVPSTQALTQALVYKFNGPHRRQGYWKIYKNLSCALRKYNNDDLLEKVLKLHKKATAYGAGFYMPSVDAMRYIGGAFLKRFFRLQQICDLCIRTTHVIMGQLELGHWEKFSLFIVALCADIHTGIRSQATSMEVAYKSLSKCLRSLDDRFPESLVNLPTFSAFRGGVLKQKSEDMTRVMHLLQMSDEQLDAVRTKDQMVQFRNEILSNVKCSDENDENVDLGVMMDREMSHPETGKPFTEITETVSIGKEPSTVRKKLWKKKREKSLSEAASNCCASETTSGYDDTVSAPIIGAVVSNGGKPLNASKELPKKKKRERSLSESFCGSDSLDEKVREKKLKRKRRKMMEIDVCDASVSNCRADNATSATEVIANKSPNEKLKKKRKKILESNVDEIVQRNGSEPQFNPLPSISSYSCEPTAFANMDADIKGFRGITVSEEKHAQQKMGKKSRRVMESRCIHNAGTPLSSVKATAASHVAENVFHEVKAVKEEKLKRKRRKLMNSIMDEIPRKSSYESREPTCALENTDAGMKGVLGITALEEEKLAQQKMNRKSRSVIEVLRKVKAVKEEKLKRKRRKIIESNVDEIFQNSCKPQINPLPDSTSDTSVPSSVFANMDAIKKGVRVVAVAEKKKGALGKMKKSRRVFEARCIHGTDTPALISEKAIAASAIVENVFCKVNAVKEEKLTRKRRKVIKSAMEEKFRKSSREQHFNPLSDNTSDTCVPACVLVNVSDGMKGVREGGIAEEKKQRKKIKKSQRLIQVSHKVKAVKQARKLVKEELKMKRLKVSHVIGSKVRPKMVVSSCTSLRETSSFESH